MTSKNNSHTVLPSSLFHIIRAAILAWPGQPEGPGSLLVKIRDGGQMVPLFFCCQGPREVTNLANYLAPDRPVYALRSTYRLARSTDTNIRALASHYSSELVQVQEHGPFLLGGFCSGARVAWEVAQQLITLGRSVALLVLIERDLDSRSLLLSMARFVTRYRARLRVHRNNILSRFSMLDRFQYILSVAFRVFLRGAKHLAVLPVAHGMDHRQNEPAYILSPLSDSFSGKIILLYVNGSEYDFFRFRVFQRHWDRLAAGRYHVLMIPGENHGNPSWPAIAEIINFH